MKQLTITTTGQNQVLDITEMVNLQIPDNFDGIVCINALHTTCAITTADLDPGTDQDLIDAIKDLVPKIRYRHPHNPDPEHVGDHIMSSLIGTSLTLPVSKGCLMLGTWQRVVFVEMDGPRKRNLIVSLIKSE